MAEPTPLKQQLVNESNESIKKYAMTTTMKYTREPCAYIMGCPAHCSLAWADTITVTQQDRHGVEFPCNATAYSTACAFRLTTQKLSNICIADVLAGESTGDLFLQSSNSESVLYVMTTQLLFYYFFYLFPLQGMHGIEEEVYLSLPSVVGENGITHVFSLKLTPEEQTHLHNSAKTLAAVIAGIQF